MATKKKPVAKKKPTAKKTERGMVKKATEQQSAFPAILNSSNFNLERIEVTAASIKDGILMVAYSKYHFGLPKPIESMETSPNKVHSDLINKFDKLKPHFVMIADFKDWKTINPTNPPQELMERIKVTGYHLKGEDDKRAIIITGQKRKANNQVVCLNTPLQKFEDNAFPYDHAEELKDVLAEIEEEILLCLNGKYAPLPTLFDEVEGEEKEAIAEPEVEAEEEV